MKSKTQLDLMIELQALSQAGLHYSKDVFDSERYLRIQEIATKIISKKAKIPFAEAKALFCCETGYQTPKIDTRAAIFKNKKILLVQEKNKTWSLPGGWCDVGLSVRENIIKEVKEEAGLDIAVEKVIAIQDREKHNKPIYVWRICKIFVQCALCGGKFSKNSETISSSWFDEKNLPKLAEEKNNEEQIKMCFKAFKTKNWKTVVD